MHPEADALLDAIFNHPDDDTPRLVYADWLQEHGYEDYAQFIRLQCAAAHEELWSDEANRLWVEIGRVWNRLDREWMPATRDQWLYLDITPDAIHFERGFLRPNLFLTDEQFLNYLQEETCWPWASLPGCTLLLTPWGVWERLTTVPQLRRVEHLALASGVVDVGDPWETEWLPDELAVLLSSGHLRNLRELDLSPLYLTQRIADLLSTAPNLSSMQGLRISFHRRRGPDRVETLYRLRTRFKDVTWE